MISYQTHCSVCRQQELREVVAFGLQPLANAFGSTDKFPLTLMRCGNCSHFQLKEFLDAETLFTDYVYRAGANDMQKKLFKSLFDAIMARVELSASSNVLDIGSNDGTLMKFFEETGARVVGVDPAGTTHDRDTIFKPWSMSVAKQMGDYKFEVITLTNTFAHLPHLHEAVGAIATCLSPTGVCVIQVPWVRDLLQNTYYDTIYHEHKHYFSVAALRRLFQQHYMDVMHVDYLPEHGGSLRVWVKHSGALYDDLGISLARELEQPWLEDRRFFERVWIHQQMLQQLCEDGVACFGASAKGVMLMNMADLHITAVYDDTPEKIGKTVPGTDLVVQSAQDQQEYQFPPPAGWTSPFTGKPAREPTDTIGEDTVLLTAWNYADRILPRLKGKRVILPFPFPREVHAGHPVSV